MSTPVQAPAPGASIRAEPGALLVDLVLAALSLIALEAAAGRLGVTRRRPDRWLVIPGGTAFVVVVASVVNPPPPALGSDPMVGIWLALAASILMLVGVAVAVARVSVAIKLEDRPAAGPQPAARPPAARRQFPSSRRAGMAERAERPDGVVDRPAPAQEGTHPTRVLGEPDPSSPEMPPGRP